MTAPVAEVREALFGYGETAGAAYRERLMARTGLAGIKPGRALDLGCGPGMASLWLAQRGWQVEARDLVADPAWGKVAEESRGRVRFAVADAQDPGFEPGSFDLVFEKDMLHHADDPQAVLMRMAQLCRPGGRVQVIEANRLNPIFYLHLTLMGDHQHFTRPRLRRLLQGAGMGDHRLDLAEARAWPINRAWAQGLIDRCQDLAELLPPLWPFLCYHLVAWDKPAA